MSGEAPRQPREPWRGTPLTVDTANRFTPLEARVYGVVAMHACNRTRVTLNLLGRLVDERGVPMGAACAQRVVNDLHDQGLLIAAGWSGATFDTPLTFYLSGQQAPPRIPRHMRGGEDRVPVGGRFTAPRTLPPEILQDLLGTGELLKRHQQAPQEERDARWIQNLAVYTEARAAAFHAWATVDAAQVVQVEAARLTKAAQDIRVQAANRRRTEETRAS